MSGFGWAQLVSQCSNYNGITPELESKRFTQPAASSLAPQTNVAPLRPQRRATFPRR